MTNIKLVALAALLASGSAFAQEPAPPADQPPATQTPQAQDDQSTALPDFATLDINKDGAISKDEAAVHVGLTDAFASSDADQNGQLTAAEFADAQSRLTQ